MSYKLSYPFRAVILSLGWLTGCVGFYVVTPNGTSEEPARSAVTHTPVSCKSRKCSAEENSTYTFADIEDWRGKPDKQYEKNGEIVWVYSGDLAWTGIVPLIILPIPIVLPIGWMKTQYYFKADQLVHVTSDEFYIPLAGLCGLLGNAADATFRCAGKFGDYASENPFLFQK